MEMGVYKTVVEVQTMPSILKICGDGCGRRATTDSFLSIFFGVIVIIVAHGTCNAVASGQNRVAPRRQIVRCLVVPHDGFELGGKCRKMDG